MTITPWPSRCGVTVRRGRLRLEVFEHGGCTRLISDAAALTGYRGTHYARVPRGDYATMAQAALTSWDTERDTWTECE